MKHVHMRIELKTFHRFIINYWSIFKLKKLIEFISPVKVALAFLISFALWIVTKTPLFAHTALLIGIFMIVEVVYIIKSDY